MSAWTIPATKASDPGRATGDTSGYALRPDCRCRHLATVHGGEGKRKPCSAADPNKCPCKDYAPEVPDRG